MSTAAASLSLHVDGEPAHLLVAEMAYRAGHQEKTRDEIATGETYWLENTKIKASAAVAAVEHARREKSAPPADVEGLVEAVKQAIRNRKRSDVTEYAVGFDAGLRAAETVVLPLLSAPRHQPARTEGEEAKTEAARILALAGLGSAHGGHRQEPPNEDWTQEDWENRILDVIPGAAEARCLAAAETILAALSQPSEGMRKALEELRAAGEALLDAIPTAVQDPAPATLTDAMDEFRAALASSSGKAVAGSPASSTPARSNASG